MSRRRDERLDAFDVGDDELRDLHSYGSSRMAHMPRFALGDGIQYCKVGRFDRHAGLVAFAKSQTLVSLDKGDDRV